MGWLTTLESRRDPIPGRKPLGSPWDDDRWYGIVGAAVASGMDVTPDSALASTAVWAAVTLKASAIATLPLKLYRRLPGGGKDVAREHSVHERLHREPNPWQTPADFKEMMQGHVELRGRAYAQIIRSGGGDVLQLIPLHPDRVVLKQDEAGRLFYEYRRGDGTTRAFAFDEIFRIWGPFGKSPITLMREAVGLTLATERYGAKFFGADARPGGVLKTAEKLTPEAQKRVSDSWREAHSGEGGWHRVAVLEAGLEWQQIGMTSEDAQFLETRKFQITEVARMFNVPPHKLREMTRSTFNNIEQQNIEWGIDTVRPLAVRWEESANRDLLTASEAQTHFVRFSLDALLRGDNASRSQFYREMFNIGVFSINEIRELEDKNPVDDGDARFVPLNMVPLDTAGELPMPEDGRSLAEDRRLLLESRERRSITLRRRYQVAYQKVFTAIGERLTKRETQNIRRIVKAELGERGIPALRRKLEEFLEKHKEYTRAQMLPALMAYAELIQAAIADETGGEAGLSDQQQQFVREYAQAFADRHRDDSFNQLNRLIEDGEADTLANTLTQRLDEWDDRRPGKIGLRETVQSLGAFSVMAYAAASVTVLVWRALGDCPICQEMDGRTVAIERAFVEPGATIGPDGEAPLEVKHVIKHPPLHRSCSECIVVAGG